MGIDDITVETGFDGETKFSIVGNHYQKNFCLQGPNNKLQEIINS